MKQRSLALALAIAALAGCRADEPSPADLADARESSARISSLRSAGSYAEALALARERVTRIERAGSAPRWARDDAKRELATLERLTIAPDSVRAALASADQANARAESLLSGGRTIAALELAEQALATRRRLLGARHAEVAASLHSLARVVQGLGDARRAHSLDAEALAIRREAFGRRHPAVAQSLDALGMDLKLAGHDRRESLRLYREALELRRELLGEDAPEVFESLTNIANHYRVMRQPDSALAIFRRVLEHERARASAATDRTGDILFAMAMTVAPRGWSEAEPYLREAVVLQRASGGRAPLGRTLGAYGTALRHLGRSAEAEAVLEESAAIFEQLRRDAPPGISRAGQFPLASYVFLAAAQLEQDRGAAAWVSLERSLGRSLLEELARRGAVDTTGWWNGALSRVQNALSEDAAVIGWLTLRPGAASEEFPFWCYAIRKRGPVHWQRVDRPASVAGEPSDAPLDRLRRELRAAANWPLRVSDSHEIELLGRAAYERRIAPLEPWLRGVRQLVVVSPDLLHGSPLEALVDSSGRFLSDRFTFAYTPSALLFSSLGESGLGSHATRRTSALLVGNEEIPASAAGSPERLDAVGAEVQNIAAMLEAPHVLLGPEASAERLRSLAASGALARFRLIHIASHAAPEAEWLGASALLLPTGSPKAVPRGREARRTTRLDRIDVDEILDSWRLDADLVTLAACNSIAGPASPTEGYLGLQQALLAAGAREVVASLWPVDDRATALLMKKFYEGLLAKAREGSNDAPRAAFREAEALANARRWVSRWRAADGSTPYSHPVYWAGFVLMRGGQSAAAGPGS